MMTNLQDLTNAANTQLIGIGDIMVRGISADSRKIEPGFVFAALPGSVVDGRNFIPKALEQGAIAILVPDDFEETAEELNVTLLKAKDPRLALAKMAATLYPAQPETIVAITGTNGKTSIASFVRQIWQQLGLNGASLGTVGIDTPTNHIPLQHTTPEPVQLHQLIDQITREENISHLAIEASSHGLEQRRQDGLIIKAAGFTNITQDHLDYHGTMEEYFAQKLRLFSQLVVKGGIAVIDPETAGAKTVMETAQTAGLKLFTVGSQGQELELTSVTIEGYSQQLALSADGSTYKVKLPLVGGFQVSNALIAAGLCISQGADCAKVIPALGKLKGAKGRLELAGITPQNAPVFIDYAHTPDAISTALKALRPYVQNRLIIVFGCGGDRDKAKRPLMGKAAIDSADLVYVTDDNPRSEEPDAIRADIMTACPNATQIGNRAEAILHAMQILQQGDVLLLAGKGHETGQIIKGEVFPFSDHEEVEKALQTLV